jgi:hypothetical protein
VAALDTAPVLRVPQDMSDSTVSPRRISPVILGVGACAIVLTILAVAYLMRPVTQNSVSRPSAEATSYLAYLQLTDVTMKAAENLMRQQVVYIDGKIANNGPRTIERIDVFCIFSGVDSREVYRERVPVIQAAGGKPFGPNQTRSFELPFDGLPDNWNQAMPRLVIAQIRFAH